MIVISKDEWNSMPTAQRVAIRRKMASQRRKAKAFEDIIVLGGMLLMMLASGEVK
jgi:hypothetical protein